MDYLKYYYSNFEIPESYYTYDKQNLINLAKTEVAMIVKHGFEALWDSGIDREFLTEFCKMIVVCGTMVDGYITDPECNLFVNLFDDCSDYNIQDYIEYCGEIYDDAWLGVVRIYEMILQLGDIELGACCTRLLILTMICDGRENCAEHKLFDFFAQRMSYTILKRW